MHFIFIKKLKISVYCFLGVLITKWMINDSKLMTVASNVADGRRHRFFVLTMDKLKNANGVFDWQKVNYVYVLQVLNGTGGGLLISLYYLVSKGKFTCESSMVRVTMNWFISFVGIFMIRNGYNNIIDDR